MANGIDIGKAYVRIEPTAKGIGNEISRVLNDEAGSAGEKAGAKLSGGIGSGLATGLKATAAITGAAVAGVTALGSAVVNNAKETAAYGDNVDKLSQKIGISKTAFQEWDYVFSQNGADIGILETGMKTLSNTIYDASNGSDSATAKFEALGLSVEDLSKMSQEDIFGAVISALQEMPEGADRTAMATDLLGRSAMELQPLLNGSAEATEALKQQAHDLGMVMSDEAVENSAAFTDATDNLTRAVQGVTHEMGAAFLPGLTEVANGFASLIAGNDGAQESIVSGFRSMADTISSNIPTIVSTVTSIATALGEVAPDIIMALCDGLLAALPELMPVAVDLINQLINFIIANLPMIVSCGIDLLLALVNGIADNLDTLIPAAVDAILTIVDALIDHIDLLVDAAIKLTIGLAEGLIKALPRLLEKAPIIISKLVMALANAGLKLIELGGQLMQKFIQGLQNVGQKLADVGRNLVEGLKNGIINAWNSMVSKVKDMANNLVDGIKAVFKISSPSKVFEQIGDYCVQGFDESFDNFGKDALDNVEGAVSDLASMEIPAFTTDMSVRGSYQSVDNASSVYNLLAQYLPELAERSTNVNVSLEGDAQGLFREVRKQTNQFVKSTGASPFLSPA